MATKTFNSKKYGKITVTYTKYRSDMRFATDKQITEDEASTIQAVLNYNPQGYGFYSFDNTDNGSKWTCFSSCD